MSAHLKIWETSNSNDADIHELSSTLPLDATTYVSNPVPSVDPKSSTDACEQLNVGRPVSSFSSSNSSPSSTTNPSTSLITPSVSTQHRDRKRFRAFYDLANPSSNVVLATIENSDFVKRCREVGNATMLEDKNIETLESSNIKPLINICSSNNYPSRTDAPCLDVLPATHRPAALPGTLQRTSCCQLLASVLPNNHETRIVLDTQRGARLLEVYPKWEGFSRKELISLLLQTVTNLGYHATKEILELETGVLYEPPPVVALHSHVLKGNWIKAEDAVKDIKELNFFARSWCLFYLLEQQYMEYLYSGHVTDALQLLRGKLKAIACFDPSAKDRVYVLCSFLMLRNSLELCRESCWNPWTSRKLVWQQIFRYLTPTVCPPNKRLAYLLHQAIRFQELQCVHHETASLTLTAPSLFINHQCSPDNLPQRCIAVLEGHSGEIWVVGVAHHGRYFVTGCENGEALLWKNEFPVFPLKRKLTEDKGTICSLSWCCNGSWVAVSIVGDGVEIWDVETGSFGFIEEQTVTSLLHHASLRRSPLGPPKISSSSTVRWVPRKRQLLVAISRIIVLFSVSKCRDRHTAPRRSTGSEPRHSLSDPQSKSCSPDVPDSLPIVVTERCLEETSALPVPKSAEVTDGKRFDDAEQPDQWEDATWESAFDIKELHSWIFRKNVQDTAVNYDGSKLVVSLGDKIVRIFSLPPRSSDVNSSLLEDELTCNPETNLYESSITMSLCASQLKDEVLVGVNEDRHVIRLWDITTKRALQSYRGHQQRHFVLSVCFGGHNESFVLSGSEDGRIFIWNRLYGHLLTTLKGHTGTVTAVEWPLGHDWLVSVSDNREIRVWHSGKKNSVKPSCVTSNAKELSGLDVPEHQLKDGKADDVSEPECHTTACLL